MLSGLKACYSPQDMIFIITLFFLVMGAIGSSIILMIHLVKGALEEVEDMNHKRMKP